MSGNAKQNMVENLFSFLKRIGGAAFKNTTQLQFKYA